MEILDKILPKSPLFHAYGPLMNVNINTRYHKIGSEIHTMNKGSITVNKGYTSWVLSCVISCVLHGTTFKLYLVPGKKKKVHYSSQKTNIPVVSGGIYRYRVRR